MDCKISPFATCQSGLVFAMLFSLFSAISGFRQDKIGEMTLTNHRDDRVKRLR